MNGRKGKQAELSMIEVSIDLPRKKQSAPPFQIRIRIRAIQINATKAPC